MHSAYQRSKCVSRRLWAGFGVKDCDIDARDSRSVRKRSSIVLSATALVLARALLVAPDFGSFDNGTNGDTRTATADGSIEGF